MAQGLAAPHVIQVNDITRLMPEPFKGSEVEDPKEHILKYRDYLDLNNLDQEANADWPEITEDSSLH